MDTFNFISPTQLTLSALDFQPSYFPFFTTQNSLVKTYTYDPGKQYDTFKTVMVGLVSASSLSTLEHLAKYPNQTLNSTCEIFVPTMRLPFYSVVIENISWDNYDVWGRYLQVVISAKLINLPSSLLNNPDSETVFRDCFSRSTKSKLSETQISNTSPTAWGVVPFPRWRETAHNISWLSAYKTHALLCFFHNNRQTPITIDSTPYIVSDFTLVRSDSGFQVSWISNNA